MILRIAHPNQMTNCLIQYADGFHGYDGDGSPSIVARDHATTFATSELAHLMISHDGDR